MDRTPLLSVVVAGNAVHVHHFDVVEDTVFHERAEDRWSVGFLAQKGQGCEVGVGIPGLGSDVLRSWLLGILDILDSFGANRVVDTVFILH